MIERARKGWKLLGGVGNRSRWGEGREGDGTLALHLKTTGVLEIATRDF